MGDRRMSGWFILSGVFLVLVFGLFFTFTERKTWPEHGIELGHMDMRLLPPVSTLWCEAVDLHSDHSFIAYQVNDGTQINPNHLNLQKISIKQIKLGGSWNTNYIKLKYFLLPSSVIDIVTCSSYPGVELLVFKGDINVQSCLQNLAYNQNAESSDYDSDSTEENTDLDYRTVHSAATAFREICPSLQAYHSVEVSYMDDYSMDCNPIIDMHPIKVNVSSADYYVVVVRNKNRHVTNHVDLQILLDRTQYTVHRSGQTFNLCSLSTSCVIGLDFLSDDRVLVFIPEEPNAGRSSFVVRSRCKPRLAVFAVLSVLLPLFLFLAVAFVVRADKQPFAKYCSKTRDIDRGQSNRNRTVAPLLDDRNAASFESLPVSEERVDSVPVQVDEMPPPYHTLYDPPPPYACLTAYEERFTQR